MIFTLEADNVEEDKSSRYRLRENGTWRRMRNKFDLRNFDKWFNLEEKPELASAIEKSGVLMLNDQACSTDYEDGSYGYTEAVIYSALHRLEKPKRFTRDELADAIRDEDDEISNSLAIDIQGRFNVIRYPEATTLIENLSYAIIHQPWEAGEGNVGREAAEDKDHIEEYFLTSLAAWKDHLHLRASPIFVNDNDYVEATAIGCEEEVWDSIDQLFDR